MNVLEMPDTKIYERGLEILTEHFGLDGTTRFLNICKPFENTVGGVSQGLSQQVMEKIQEQIYQVYAAKQLKGNNEYLQDLSTLPDIAFYELGLEALLTELGPVGMARFIRIREPGTVDYTSERHKWLDTLDSQTVLEGIQQAEQEIKIEQTSNFE